MKLSPHWSPPPSFNIPGSFEYLKTGNLYDLSEYVSMVTVVPFKVKSKCFFLICYCGHHILLSISCTFLRFSSNLIFFFFAVSCSVQMVCFWLSGDTFKTGYFIVKEAPLQFTLCGALQVIIDLSILAQVFYYRNGPRHKTVIAKASMSDEHIS